MRIFRSPLLFSGCIGLSSVFTVINPIQVHPAIAAEPISATPPVTQASPSSGSNSMSASMQRLLRMFSPQIQNTINACQQQGKVNLAAGASAQGLVTCGDGTADSQVGYTDYVSTISDILAASSLVGFRAVLRSDPRITPEMLTTFLSNSQGQDLLRNTVQTAIAQSELFPQNETASTTLLTNEVVSRLVPTLGNPQQLDSLLGTSDQYSQVVSNFCTAPGMSINDAKQLVPDLSSVQLFAICIQESGLTDEVMGLAR